MLISCKTIVLNVALDHGVDTRYSTRSSEGRIIREDLGSSNEISSNEISHRMTRCLGKGRGRNFHATAAYVSLVSNERFEKTETS